MVVFPLPVGPVHRVEARDEHLFLASDALYRWEEDRLTELTLDGRSLGPDFALEQGIWTIQDGAHSPDLSERFAPEVLEWLLAHPKR